MLSRCLWDFSVSVGAFVIGLSQISSFFLVRALKSSWPASLASTHNSRKYNSDVHFFVFVSFSSNVFYFTIIHRCFLCKSFNMKTKDVFGVQSTLSGI